MTTPDLCEQLEELAKWHEEDAKWFPENLAIVHIKAAATIRQAISLLRRDGMVDTTSDLQIHFRVSKTWEPIETAPKTGEIIACQAGSMNIEFVRWHEGEWLDRTADPFYPTHWMPMLDIPESK